MPIDNAFASHEMALLYDSFNAEGPDTDFYLGLPDRPCRILDIGSGTGALALKLARAGHTVTALEPAAGMMAVARARDADRLVDWIDGNALDFSFDTQFDLVIMTGHVFQVFLDDQETRTVLGNIHRHLAEGGRLAFESRDPDDRAYQRWTAALTRRRALVPDIGAVEVTYQTREVSGELVTFDAVFTLEASGRRLVSPSTLRFASRETIEANLMATSFTRIEWIGGWDGRPFADESAEIIVIAGR